jgi:hypothetical protein
MAIADKTWQHWLAVLEDILREADLHREYEFGIHIDAAMLVAHAKLGTDQAISPHDDLI